MTGPTPAVVSCANCGRSFAGRYCPDCGQEVQDIRRPFGELVREFLGDFLAFDARIWRTLVPLVTRPGLVTRDTIDGRRARYVPAFRLYVFAGFVYFTVMALTGGGLFAPRITSDEGRTVISFRGAAIQTGLTTGDVADRDEVPESPEEPGLTTRFDERASAAARDRQAFARALIGSLSYGHFLLMPIFALLLEGLYRRRFFAEHLVFSLHFHAFVLLPGAALVAASVLIPGASSDRATRAIISAWTLVLVAYLFRSLRRVYGESRLRTALKLMLLGLGYGIIVGVVILGVAVATVWFY
ncbi:MAG TPA: DUF3667 domain-containing protein [Gemmatimonadota bacterium]|nr:DUF3667 domain-containing protein [Gemmatimonadota bacterium]